MFADWLAPMSLAAFTQTYFQQAPYAQPGSALLAVPLFQWDKLAQVLAADPPPDVLVVTKGKVIDLPPPQTLMAMRTLLDAGYGVVIRRAERHEAGLATLATTFAQVLGGEVHVQLFVTASHTYSFGWHYDEEEVFIVQTGGIKDYFLRENTVSCMTPPHAQPDFQAIRREVSPLATVRLLPGDWLYIPARWWHVAQCREESLSISVGVLTT